MALETEFVGSKTCIGKVAFQLVFSTFFLLPSFSSSFSSPWFYLVSSVYNVVPILGATLLWDQLPAMEINYRDQLVTPRGDLYEKILAAPSVEQKHGYKFHV